MSCNKLLKDFVVDAVLIIPLSLVLLTVLIIDNSMANPTVSAKYIWFGIALILSSICSPIIMFFNKKRIKLSIIDYLLSIFILWGIFITYYHYNDFTFKLYILLFLWVFYAISRITIEQYKFYGSVVLLVLIITGLFEAVWGLGQLYGIYFSQNNYFVITGSFYNPGPYAGYLSLVLPISLYYILSDYKVIANKKMLIIIPIFIRWVISLLALITIILILPATMSRASWIAAFISCLFIVIHYILTRIKGGFCLFLNNRIILILFFCFSILIAIITMCELYSFKKDSANGRFLIWKNSITAIVDNPGGVGIGYFSGTYGKEQKKYFAAQLASKEEQFIAGSPESAFNEYLQIGVEFGFAPLLLFIFIIIYTFHAGYKNKEYPAMGGLISLLVFAGMSYPFNLLPFLIVLLVFIVLCVSNRCDEKRREINRKTILCYIIAILGLLLIVGIVAYRYRSLKDAYVEWNEIRILNNEEHCEKYASEYRTLYSFLRHERSFLFEYAKCLNEIERYEESNQILKEMGRISCDPMVYNIMGRNYQAMNQYLEAEEAFKMASFLIPHRLYPYYLLIKLYDEIENKDELLKVSELFFNQKVKIRSEATDEMRKEVQRICNKYLSE